MSELLGYDSKLFLNSDYSETTFEIGGIKQTVLCLNSSTTDLDLTGQIVWPASQVLSWFLHQFPDLVRNKTVLELGSGCGLAGLVAAQLGASTVYLTDSSPVILHQLQKTIELNCNQGGGEKRISRLEWGQQETIKRLIDEFKEQGKFPDVIIAADVFQTSFGSPALLFQSIKHITESHPSKKMTFYVCFALRKTTKEELVKECAQEEGFILEEVSLPSQFSKQSLRRSTLCNASVEELSSSLLPSIFNHFYLAYERVALPCSTLSCGDVIYRSTLDPNLRMEQHGIAPLGLFLIAACVYYLFITPGVIPGMIDFYFTAALQRTKTKVYNKADLKLGKKLGGGGFGLVYKADLKTEDGKLVSAVVKKAKEFGEAEVWMNERLMRLPQKCCAEFITAFEEATGDAFNWRGAKTDLVYSGDTQGKDYHVADPPLWLVWKYEGDFTLYDLLQQKDFPYNLEPYLLGRELTIPKGPYRKLVSIKIAMQQILEALKLCHSVGIVHRDVKPQNCILSEQDLQIKFIDLGAAADLRIGINYVPNEFLLDPRYAPPQNYIMSTQTPRAPSAPLAALLSPILWHLEKPDRFDMYSAGVIFLQMIFPKLRSDNNLIAFNRKLESLDYDIEKWRKIIEQNSGKEFKEGFQMMDMEDAAGWSLVKKLLVYDPTRRLSASQAIRHRFFNDSMSMKFLEDFTENLDKMTRPVLEELRVDEVVTGTQRVGGLTERELAEALGEDKPAPRPSRDASYTIAWWKNRQASLNKKIKQKKEPESISESRKIDKKEDPAELEVSASPGFFTTLGLSRKS
eukprot:g6576.t1